MSSVLYDRMDDERESFLKPKVRYTPVWITLVLSFVTLGIYLPYWLLTRREEVNRIAGKTVISKKIPVLILVGYIFSNIVFIIGPFFINEIAMMLFEYVDTLITYFGLIFIVFYSFRIRSVLLNGNQADSINGVLTFLFTIWYLQFHINKNY